MSGKKAGSGLGARMAAHPGMSAVDAGLAAATGAEPAEVPTEAPAVVEAPAAVAKAEVVALNIRLPKAMHRQLRDIAHRDETYINAILIEAATDWLASPKAKPK